MNKKTICAALVTFALCVAALTGCGGGNAGTGNNDAATKAPVKSGDASAVSPNAVTVKNVEELLEAIAPGVELVISPGYYNMSEYVNNLYATEGDAWNAEHQYVELEDCYDGAEVIVKNVKNLSISGGGAMADTEIVIDPEYGTVFTFKSCSGVKLSNLTLGHTQGAVCSGNVVDLIACENVELRNTDLYGCGVIALNCEGGTGDVYVYDSVLRDCSYGPISIYGGAGKFEFRDCTLTGSSDGGYFDGGGRSQLGFYNCVFGSYETYRWKYAENVETENCTWDDSIDYPDGEYPDIEPDGAYYGENSDGEYYDGEAGYEPESLPENPQEAPLDMELYGDSSWWLGYVVLNPDTGEYTDMPSPDASATDVSMYLRADGTGVISGYYADRSIPFLWETDSENPAKLSLTTLHDGNFEITCYRVEGDNPDFPVWLTLRAADRLLWMY